MDCAPGRFGRQTNGGRRGRSGLSVSLHAPMFGRAHHRRLGVAAWHPYAGVLPRVGGDVPRTHRARGVPPER